MRFILPVAVLATVANAYFLMAVDTTSNQRIDPIVSPGNVSSHVHMLMGGGNLRISTTTASLRQSICTSTSIKEDKSAYWVPLLYFQWKNGSFTSVTGGAVVYYLYSNTPGTTTPFPDDFRMITGDPTLRTYNASSYAQQAVTFLCLDFQGTSARYNELPATECPSGIRSQLNFPSCWDGKNVDSPDHKSHVAFLSTGPDSGTCSDPKYPETLPRIFMEVYWASQEFDSVRDQAMNPQQPFVFSDGDPTGYGYHGDFFMGWQPGVLQKVVDECNCNPFGDFTCCTQKGLFTLNSDRSCQITNTWDEQTLGTLHKLPGNNPVQPAGKSATMLPNNYIPPIISPVVAYTGNTPPPAGTDITPGHSLGAPNQAPPATSSSPNHVSVPPKQPSSTQSNAKGKTPSPSPTDKVDLTNPSPSPSPSSPKESDGKSSISKPTATPVPGEDDGDNDDSGYCTPPKNTKARSLSKRSLKKHRHRRTHNAASGDFSSF